MNSKQLTQTASKKAVKDYSLTASLLIERYLTYNLQLKTFNLL